MTIERRIARLFNLTDDNWMKHANPISVWTRYSVLPLLVLAIWSRAWIGWWSAAAIAMALLWMFFNPVLFAKPKSTRNWASKSVLGERVYLNRDQIPLPEWHNIPLQNLLSALASCGLILAIWGSIDYVLWAAISGVVLAIIAKSWFLDRMVWLYEDMKNRNERYSSWDY